MSRNESDNLENASNCLDICEITDIFDDNESIILFICNNGDVNDMNEFILKNGVNWHLDETENTLLILSCIYNRLDLVKLLIEHNADLNLQNSDLMTALHEAVKNQNIKIVELLLSHHANPLIADKNQEMPLDIAIKLNDKEISELLMQKCLQII